MTRQSVLLIISGSIAAFKSLDVIRQLSARNIEVRCILTKGGEHFVSALSIASLTGNQTYTDLFSLKDESEMGHIRLTRDADLVVVAPASADLMAKMAGGFADDLASAALLASNKPIMIAPAMNTQMWQNAATLRNVAQLVADGVQVIEPGAGMLACGEVGAGRMAEPDVIVEAILARLTPTEATLKGLHALVTSGPTHEAIDPVRYIGNHSSGKQGHAIAAELARRGANVTLVSGPTALADPANVSVKRVTSAEEMLKACEQSLPADIVVCAAAVADWRVSQPSARKLKKIAAGAVPELHLIENPDILAYLSTHPSNRAKLVVGFAAETENVLENAAKKRKSKGCDWVLANDVSGDKAFGADHNEITLINAQGQTPWPLLSKVAIAARLADHIVTHFSKEAL
jgi:phosphopantothenoylcysteine decarboxylase/phosphopantothenate--cysteine ligase